jgi:peptidoglycan/LPS O-acetylase OafA/YrhL
MRFRADVDGLRGVAVLLVVAYHARVGLVPAGYVGVDVFLVISGFLITDILANQIDAGRFSMRAFLTRRLYRLMPAAVLMVAATLAAGFAILGPGDLVTLAGSSLAVLGLVANFFFWGRQGYFVDQVPEQPLLHTWSLGLEEQFYLLFPLVLLAVALLAPRRRLALFVLGGAGLLAFSAWLTGVHPGGAFYLPVSRAWEFLLGGLVALVGRGGPLPAPLRELAAGAGVAGIIVAATCLTPQTPYPGIAACLPAGAAALAILGGAGRAAIAGRILALPPLVAVGTISYSLYLWHWPVLTLARDYAGRDLGFAETLAALAAIAVLSVASWKWVERPYRLRADPAARRSLLPFAVLAAAIAGVAVTTIAASGFPGRLSPLARRFDAAGSGDATTGRECHHGPPELVSATGLCTLATAGSAGARILLWGDSHANAIAPALAALGRARGALVVQASYSGCPPLLEARVAHQPHTHYCREFNAMALAAVAELHITRVVLAAYWSAYLPERPEPGVARLLDPYRRATDLGGGDATENARNFADALGRTVAALEQRGVEVWILRQVPAQRVYVPLALARAASRGVDYDGMGIPLDAYRAGLARVDREFAALDGAVHELDPAAALCSAGICRMAAGTVALYTDANHLSADGALRLGGLLTAVFH